MTEEVEVKAREMGWAPKEEFRGDPEKWIDAETFVKRGEELMPLLKANNKRLSDDLNAVRSELRETKDLLKASAESIEALKEFNSNIVRREAKEKQKELKEALVEAKREGDVEKEVEITEQLQEHTAALKDAEKKAGNGEGKPKESSADDYTQNPDWKAWVKENEWFSRDKRKTALALGIADDLKSNPETANLTGKAFLDKVSEEVEKIFGGPRTGLDKVEGGGRGTSKGGGKSFADLPEEARQACERQAERLVGPGRAFKSTKEWRDHYAKQYFGAE